MSRSKTSHDDADSAGGCGLLIVLAGPSGTGKSTILKEVFVLDPRLAFSVSHTTRAAREGEVDGRDYHFVDDAAFDALIRDEAFVEWAHVHGRRYGTAKREISRLQRAGFDIVFDIDVQGAENLCAALPESVSIFLLPPSLETLDSRLRGRGTETEANLALRLANARREIARASGFQYFVVNTSIHEAAQGLRSIIAAERLRAHHHEGMPVRLLAGDAIASPTFDREIP